MTETVEPEGLVLGLKRFGRLRTEDVFHGLDQVMFVILQHQPDILQTQQVSTLRLPEDLAVVEGIPPAIIPDQLAVFPLGVTMELDDHPVPVCPEVTRNVVVDEISVCADRMPRQVMVKFHDLLVGLGRSLACTLDERAEPVEQQTIVSGREPILQIDITIINDVVVGQRSLTDLDLVQLVKDLAGLVRITEVDRTQSGKVGQGQFDRCPMLGLRGLTSINDCDPPVDPLDDLIEFFRTQSVMQTFLGPRLEILLLGAVHVRNHVTFEQKGFWNPA